MVRRFTPFWAALRRGRERALMELVARTLEVLPEMSGAGDGPWAA